MTSQNNQEAPVPAPTPETSPPEEETPAYQQRSFLGYLNISVRGLLIGSADVIPGVSGGTVALIVGIYRELVCSIRSFGLQAIQLLLKGKIREFIAHTNFYFLLALLIGVATAIISLARILPHLLYTYPAPTRGLFFGLILASIYVVWHRVHRNDITTYVLLVLGALGAYLFVGLIPVQTPDHLTFIFLSGFIAICAMILPGISGAFLLLILGKYSYILEALSSVIHQRKFDHNLVVVIVFILGCVCGLLAFSRVLNWLLTRYNAFTLAMLTGLMIGSLRKIWPFQQPTEEALYVRPIIEQFHWPFANEILLSIDKKTLFLQNHWPQQWNAQTSLALSLVVVGILIVFSLDYLAHKKDK